ncbi:TPA: hypothetical protein ACQYE6_004570 [Vibrio parahaemolyticus]|uniref:hypothetical protein n=1 Tax=Vibrio sp. E14 TaxID=2849869 RepID=UPI001CF9056C|nr:hypothetical protein [Vibrio sp. E14]EHK9046078.1 hypothetical protein [Vibrio vulnificus]
MFFTSNEIVMRRFKREQKRFLQLGYNDQLDLGDIFEWDGWRTRIIKKETLSRLGIDYAVIDGCSIDDSRKIASESGVTVDSDVINFSGKSRYLMQAFQSQPKYIDTLELCDKITQKVASGTLQWNKNWIIVTEICHAESYSRFISGAKSANVQFDIADVLGVNIADPNVSVKLSTGINSTDSIINRRNCKPYFKGVKYRKDGGRYSLIPYAANWKDKLQELLCDSDN